MPTISRAYHAHSGNYRAGGNARRYIVVHNTGNTASALNEAKYAQNNQHESSYHYVLDGTGTIYQILDDMDTAWAVGAWKGASQIIGNAESISIEVVSDGAAFTAAEKDELRWLVRKLMGLYHIPASRVVRHWDCHTGRKQCPAYYVDAARWAELLGYITEEDDMPTVDEIWNFKASGTRAQDRLAGIDKCVWKNNNALSDLHEAVCTAQDASGRGKKSTMPVRLAHMAAKQEAMQDSIDAISDKLDTLTKAVEALSAK